MGKMVRKYLFTKGDRNSGYFYKRVYIRKRRVRVRKILNK